MENSVIPYGTPLPKNNTFGTGRICAMLAVENTPPPGPRHDIAVVATNIGDQVRASRTTIPSLSIRNPGDYVEGGFHVLCVVDSSGVEVYVESLVVSSIGIGETLGFTFPAWEVGPDGAEYVVRLFHDLESDENRRNDTLSRTTTASDNIIRVAIEVNELSIGRIAPNACYVMDSLCRSYGWTSTIVTGSEVDEWDKLAAYDVLVTGDVGLADNDYEEFDELLLRWVRAGGGFVGAGWLVNGIYHGPGPNSAMDSVGPVDCSDGYAFVSGEQVRILDSSHPITSGVSNFSVQDYGEYPEAGVRSGALVLGDYTAASGVPAIACQEVGTGRTVYLGPIYFGDFSIYNNEPYFGDENARRLLRQAIHWAASGPGLAVSEPVVPSGKRLLITEIRPNPMGERVSIGYSAPMGSRLSIEVYDLAGRLVRVLERGIGDGSGHLNWDRTDEQGRTISPGVYFCRIRSDVDSDTRKLIVR